MFYNTINGFGSQRLYDVKKAHTPLSSYHLNQQIYTTKTFHDFNGMDITWSLQIRWLFTFQFSVHAQMKYKGSM